MEKQTCEPAVDLREIVFLNVKPGAVQRAVFLVKHLNGEWEKVKVWETESWLEVVKKRYSPKKDELRFEVKARGEELGKTYRDFIEIKANGQTLKIKVELVIRKKRKTSRKPAIPTAQPITQPAGQLTRREKQLPVWPLILLALLVIAGGVALFSRISPNNEKGRPPESLDRWIENTLMKELPHKTGEWYDFWHNDWATKGDDIWVVGGITFTTQEYLFETINFVYHSPDKGKNWQVSWRTDQWYDTIFFGAKKISVRSQDKIEVTLVGPFYKIFTLKTANSGATWGLN